jgi:DNA polymerase-3 subunit gamma/tau
VPASAETPGQPDAAAVRAVWSELRSKVRDRSRTVEVMLSGATVHAVEGNTIVLTHESAPLAKRLVEPRNAEVLRDALRDLFGVEWEIRCESGQGGPQPAVKRPQQRQTARTDSPPTFSRPSRAQPVKQAAEDDVPPPDGPDLPDDPEPPEPAQAFAAPATTPEDEEEMLKESAEPVAPGDRRDPDDIALELLKSELGAKRIEG